MIMIQRKIRVSKWHVCVVATVLLSVGYDFSSPNSKPSSSLLKVVVTSSILCDLTQQIAGQTIDLTCLVKPGIDPHAYALTPCDRKSIEKAQLILYNGYGLEPNLEKVIQTASGDIAKAAVAEQAVPQVIIMLKKRRSMIAKTGISMNKIEEMKNMGAERMGREWKKPLIHMCGTAPNKV